MKNDGQGTSNTKKALILTTWIWCGFMATVEANTAMQGHTGTDHFEQPAARGLRSVVAWNPCSLKAIDREQELQAAFAKMDLVLLVGTRCRANDEMPIELIRQGDKHWALRAGWRPGRGANKATGVEMWFNKTVFNKRNMHHTITGPYPGRTLETRLISGRYDISVGQSTSRRRARYLHMFGSSTSTNSRNG